MNIVTTTVKLRYDCISAKKTVEGKFLKFTPILLIKKQNFSMYSIIQMESFVCFGNKLTFVLQSTVWILWIIILCFDFSGLLSSISNKL